MKNIELNLMRDVLISQGIQVLYLIPPYSNISDIDYGFRKYIAKDYDYTDILGRITSYNQKQTLLFLSDNMRLHYCAFFLPGENLAQCSGTLCFAGPVRFHTVTNAEFHTFIRQNDVPSNLEQDVQEFFNRIPFLPSSDNWTALITPFARAILGLDMKVIYEEKPLLNNVRDHIQEYSSDSDHKFALQALTDRYEMESLLLEAVTNGNTDLALSYCHQFKQFRFKKRFSDLVRESKNYSIVLNTLFRKAVQLAKVHPFYIDELSSSMALQIEACTSVSQIDSLTLLMLHKYCLLVKNHSHKSTSPLISRCMDYIDLQYQSELSLDSLAKMCSVTNSYLSSQFRKEVDMTITDYINSTRIKHSLFLLNTTDQSIQDIAINSGFSDANYFTRTFKKYQGMSPKDYRKSVRI